MAAEPSITCPRCGRTSYNPNDIRELYCGFCHWWTSDPVLGQVTFEEASEAAADMFSPGGRGTSGHRARKNIAIRFAAASAAREGKHVHLVGPDGDECYGQDPPCEPRRRPRGPSPSLSFYDEAKEFTDADPRADH